MQFLKPGTPGGYGADKTQILSKSEHFFEICDEATGLAEVYSQRKASLLSVFEKYITADIVVLMLLIGYEFIKAVRYAAMNRVLQKKVYIDGATGLPNRNKCDELLSQPDAGHQRHGESNCATLNYATATSPLGPYTYRGVIIDNWGSDRNLVNNHGSIAEIDGQWYIFYHRPTHASSSMRKVCMEPIVFNPDGTINEVEMTTQGCGGPINPLLRMDAARACLLSGHTTVVVRRPAHSNPVEYLSAIRNGDCAYWKYFDFTGMEVNSFICKTWGKNAAGTIEIRLDKPDGELIGTCELQPMNGDVAYSVHRTKVKPVTGVHALVLVFKNNDPSMTGQDFMNLEWFMFENHDR